MCPGSDGNTRANSIPPGGESAHQQRVPAVCKVFEHGRRLPHVTDHYFFIPIIVQIAYSQTARGVNVGDTRTAPRREIEELTVTTVPIKQSWLLVLFGGVAGIYFGIDMTI